MIEWDGAAQAVLVERARRLAQPLIELTLGAGGEDESSLLVVKLGDERVGIALDHITEVYRAAVLTPIPGARPPIVGLIAWRGRVLTVLDVAHSRRSPLAMTESARILVIGRRSAAFGILADDVEEVQAVDTDTLAPVEEVAPDRRDLIRGVTADALIVLDAAALIARFAPTQTSTGGRE